MKMMKIKTSKMMMIVYIVMIVKMNKKCRLIKVTQGKFWCQN